MDNVKSECERYPLLESLASRLDQLAAAEYNVPISGSAPASRGVCAVSLQRQKNENGTAFTETFSGR